MFKNRCETYVPRGDFIMLHQKNIKNMYVYSKLYIESYGDEYVQINVYWA